MPESPLGNAASALSLQGSKLASKITTTIFRIVSVQQKRQSFASLAPYSKVSAHTGEVKALNYCRVLKLPNANGRSCRAEVLGIIRGISSDS